ncbi:MAG: hypothetical protein KJ950_03990 [Proteobacteria bacterium]|nr:hypothetical protein [Pseudomonadota bacterium]MBU1688367.1 hypothetical protein [Pseudomonadota bacterium]
MLIRHINDGCFISAGVAELDNNQISSLIMTVVSRGMVGSLIAPVFWSY